jgi:hypothetical protein
METLIGKNAPLPRPWLGRASEQEAETLLNSFERADFWSLQLREIGNVFLEQSGEDLGAVY